MAIAETAAARADIRYCDYQRRSETRAMPEA